MKKLITITFLIIAISVLFCIPSFAAANYAVSADVSFRGSDGKKELDANSGKYFAEYAIDGDPSTYAIAGGEYAWSLLLDLKDVKENVGEVAITFADDIYIAPKYDILISVDGESWTTVVTVDSNTDGKRRVHSFAPQPARYVRVADKAARNSKSMRLAEVEIYPSTEEIKPAVLVQPVANSNSVDVNDDIILGMSTALSEKYAYKAKLTDSYTGKDVKCHRILKDGGRTLVLRPYIRLEKGKKYTVSFDSVLEESFVTCDNNPMRNVTVNRYGRLTMVSTTEQSEIDKNKFVIDGDTTTAVGVSSSFFGDEAMVLELDFNMVYDNVSRAEVVFASTPALFYISASSDGKNWDIINKTYTKGVASHTIDFTPISARYIRIYTSEGYMSISEFSAYCLGMIDDFSAELNVSENPNDSVVVNFERQVVPETVNNETIYITQNGNRIDSEYLLNDDRNSAIVTAELLYDTEYSIVVTNGIKDDDGNSLKAKDDKFKTGTEIPLGISSVSSDSYMTDKENAIYPAFVDNLEYQSWTVDGSKDFYQIKTEGGYAPFSFSIVSGRLPEGLLMDREGKISGVATKEETTEFTVKVTDRKGNVAEKQLSMTAHPYRSKWFADAKFGLMTQWGPNAVTFAEYSYKDYDQAWNGTKKQIEYFENMIKDSFDADEWADEIAKSGAKVFNYMVCAGNGLRLYDSKIESTVNAHLNINMIGELIDACHKRGIKFVGYMAPENSWADKFDDKDIETQSVSKLRINVLEELLKMGMDGVWIDAGWYGCFVDWDLLVATMRTVNPFATLQSNGSIAAFRYTPQYPNVDINTFECTNLDATDNALHVAYPVAVRKKMATEQTGLLGSRWLGHTPIKTVDGVINNIKENWENGVTYLLVVGPDMYGKSFIDTRMRKEYDEICEWVRANINACDMPEMSLENDEEYESPQMLELSSQDGAVIYYTLDGTEPTKESDVYTEPVKIDKSTRVKAIACKEGLSDSRVSEFSVVIKDSLKSKSLINGDYVVDGADLMDESRSIMTGMEIQVGKCPIMLNSIGRFATGNDGDRHHISIYKNTADAKYILSGEMDVTKTEVEEDGFQYYNFAPVRLEAFSVYYILCEEDAETTHYYGNLKDVKGEDVFVRNGVFTDSSWTQMFSPDMHYPVSHQLLNLKYEVLYDEESADGANIARTAVVELRDNNDNPRGPSANTMYASNAIDGDYSTKAAAAYAYAWTLWVDLGREYEDINNIKLKFGKPNGFATEFKIYASSDDINYTEITHVTDNEEIDLNLEYVPFNARYFKIRSLKPDAGGQKGGQMAVHEFEVYTQK